MVSFSLVDILIITGFFLVLLSIGVYASRYTEDSTENFLLSDRKVGLLLFIFTNVSTWYGGILGVGEFTYTSGILSWITQGLPYYLFAIIFAFFFAEKVRNSSLYTIPDKIEIIYGKMPALISSIFIFVLVSPAPYILMTGALLQIIFNIPLLLGLIIALLFSSVYLIKGGYRTDLITDVFQFFVMFLGFIVIVIVSFNSVGDIDFLIQNLPPEHLSLTGGQSPLYVTVWFLIALWTFADPGFHQRCYAARDGRTAKYGILISVIFWLLFDFLTTTTGLFSRAYLKNLIDPVLAFPIYADKILGSGLKGLFFAALFATIISTSNSFLFLSGTTFGNDIMHKFGFSKKKSVNYYTKVGIIIAGIISVLLAFFVKSVVSIWYIIGSIFIPGLILLIIGAYYDKFRIDTKFATAELISGSLSVIIWLLLRPFIDDGLSVIEPMIVGLTVSFIIHLLGLLYRRFYFSSTKK
ncbi:sodium:solute symporter family protein [Melioribacter sp. OK-6-Me]|uniref:sodium:solute symporter family protein n=1 Tax=unclassified Melioribacter TaxID=2627329 RepID=UPI003EDA617F